MLPGSGKQNMLVWVTWAHCKKIFCEAGSLQLTVKECFKNNWEKIESVTGSKRIIAQSQLEDGIPLMDQAFDIHCSAGLVQNGRSTSAGERTSK
jgi:hypothetical protein